MAIVPAYPFILTNGTIADATQVMADFDSVKNAVNSNAAANGANSDITSLTGLTTPLSIAQGGSGTATPGSGVVGTVGGYRNILRRNGAIQIWQRGAGGAASFAIAASSPQYTADGWYLNNGANQASVVSQQAGINSPSQWCARVQRNSGQTGVAVMTFGFPLDTDELFSMLGQFVRLSFVAKAGGNWSPASGNLNAQLCVGTGTPVRFTTGYTGGSLPLSATQALTTTATRYQFNSSVIVPTSTRQAEVAFTWTPVGTAGVDDSFYIDDVQLEIVPAATGYVSSDFERLNFTEQLTLCQRHFWKTFDYNLAPQAGLVAGSGEHIFSQGVGASATPDGISIQFPVLMRVVPTITWYAPNIAGNAIYNFTRTATWSGPSLVQSSTRNTKQSAGTPVGSASGDRCAVQLIADSGI